MRTLIFLICVLLGACAGLLAGLARNDMGVAIIMAAKWSVPGVIVGALLSSLGRKKNRRRAPRERGDVDKTSARSIGGHGTKPKDLEANYWRDEGHAPFTNPSDHDPRG